MKHGLTLTLMPCAVALTAAAILSGCGGSSNATASSGGGSTASGASVSSGPITAFGSVFVNGLEYATTSAVVIDDDTLTSTTSTAGLEVGTVVDVRAAANSTAQSPVASELHVHPLARGVVDVSDTAASTLGVMGQTVQLTAATVFGDHRACVTAATSACMPITGQSGLAATTGTGSTAVAGNYVSVDGYLYAAGAVSAGANVVATLVSIHDAPTAASAAAYKTEGAVTAVSGSTITIGTLSIDLSHATCDAAGAMTPCATAFSAGQVVSAFAATAPALPAATFAATTALLRSRLPVETTGATIDLEGPVSSVTATPAAFVVRGVNVDASGLSASSLPAVGDDVRVSGTVAAGGMSITATAITVVRALPSASYGFAGTVSSVAAGSAANTYVLSLLGQSITVDASTRLADDSVAGAGRGGSSTSPFNIGTFQTYLAASASQYLRVQTAADAGGALTALSVVIEPASKVASVSGVVDATPAPVNSSATGTPTTFSVHGVPVSADPSAVVSASALHRSATATTIAAGDYVIVRGSDASGTLTVTASTGVLSALVSNVVIDAGVPAAPSLHGCF